MSISKPFRLCTSKLFWYPPKLFWHWTWLWLQVTRQIKNINKSLSALGNVIKALADPRHYWFFHYWCDCGWEYISVSVHDACKRVDRAWRERYVSCINANGTHLFVISNVRGMSHIETTNSPFNCESPWAAIRARAMSQPVCLHSTLTALFACYWLNCLLFQSHTCCDWRISKRGMGHRYVSPSVQVTYYLSKTRVHKHTTHSII